MKRALVIGLAALVMFVIGGPVITGIVAGALEAMGNVGAADTVSAYMFPLSALIGLATVVVLR